MSLIYSDSFQADEDLCRVLAAMQLGNPPPADTPSSAPPHSAHIPIPHHPSGVVNDGRENAVVDQQDRRAPPQERNAETSAGGTCPPAQRRVPNKNPPSEYLIPPYHIRLFI